MKKLTTEEFIEKAREVHGDKYDYSKVEYINSRTKICIICPKHGEFWQKPSSHLMKRGCPCCKKEKISQFQKELRGGIINGEDFIKRSIKIHGNKYSYEKVLFEDAYKEVCIICPKHGEFWQKPILHVKGYGCSKCGNEIVSKTKTKTLEKFISESNICHHWKYDYSKTVYKGCYNKVIVTCPIHGDFTVRPCDHLAHLSGCPKCKQSILERNVDNLLSDNNFEYKYEKHFKWLGYQSIDFYLSELNIGIECQGIQHFKDGGLYTRDISLEDRISLDYSKKKKCSEHNIDILYLLPNFVKQEDVLNEGVFKGIYTPQNVFYNVDDIKSFLLTKIKEKNLVKSK